MGVRAFETFRICSEGGTMVGPLEDPAIFTCVFIQCGVLT
jgi:hypothetical protein